MTNNEILKSIQEKLGLTNAGFADELWISEITLKKYRTGENAVPDERISAAKLVLIEKELAGAMKIERDIVQLVRFASMMHKESVELIHEPEAYRFRCGEIELSYRTGFIVVSCDNQKNRLAKTLRDMATGWKIGQIGR